MATSQEKVALAAKHLDKVHGAWDPPDWLELSLFGFYALEAAVDAACIHFGLVIHKSHPARAKAARQLHAEHGLPDVAELLRDLNETRKSQAYGEVGAPELEAEEVARRVEEYVDAVASLI